MIKQVLQKLARFEDLSEQEAESAVKKIIEGKLPNSQIAAFFTALRMKRETSVEIYALAKVMKQTCVKIHPAVEGNIIDVCGVGGDGSSTFNISTAVAFVVAGCGIPVAKHCSRAMSSTCGSADVLSKLGINLNTPPEVTSKIIEQTKLGFLYAPVYHPLMKRLSKVRAQIGITTVFNIAGAVSNPAPLYGQLIGVFEKDLIEPVAQVLLKLGIKSAMVVHSQDGLDEISIFDKTRIAYLQDGQLSCREIEPEEFGIKREKGLASIKVLGKANCARELLKILSGEYPQDHPKVKIVLVNASAALVVAQRARDFKEGFVLALDALYSKKAHQKLLSILNLQTQFQRP